VCEFFANAAKANANSTDDAKIDEFFIFKRVDSVDSKPVQEEQLFLKTAAIQMYFFLSLECIVVDEVNE
jgi:hypothetical protein